LHLPYRIRVMSGEGGIDDVARREQLLGAGEIGDVGRDLPRPDGVIGETADLRQLDLRVPIGALDETAHELAAVRAGGLSNPVTKRSRSFLISLDGDAEP